MAIPEADIETRAVLALGTSSTGRLFAASLAGLRARETVTSDWQSVLPRLGEPAYPVTAIAIALNGAILAGIPGGFGLSHDDGVSWNFVALPDPIAVITSLAVDQDGGLMLAGTEQDGMFRSVDGGASWTAWNFGLLDAGVLSPAISGDGSIYAGTTTGLFVSRNRGRSWTTVNLPFEFDAILSLAVQGTSIFIGTESNGLWVSSNEASPWARCAALPDSMIQFLTSDTVNAIIASGESGLWLSRDNGENWSTIELPSDIEVTSIAHFRNVDEHPSIHIGFSDGTISLTSIGTKTIHP